MQLMSKKKESQRKKEEIKRILDDIHPKQRRDYHYQKITDKHLYDVYYGEVIHGDSVSKSFFIYSIVAKENVRYLKKQKFCPLCEKLKNGSVSPKLIHQKN